MGISFGIMMVAFLLMSIDYAFLIAFITAFLDALPFFGSGIVLIPWAIFVFFTGNTRIGIWLVIIYCILTVVRRLLEPKLVSSKVGINPILTLISMYIGYKLWSVIGMIIGPVVAMLIISFYKAGVFDKLIDFIRKIGLFIKSQFKMFVNFIKGFLEGNNE